jgi:DNA-directed RNA polymerase specialized sigma24 family protein
VRCVHEAAVRMRRRVLRHRSRGLSVAVIAALVGLTPRRVRQILATARREVTLEAERRREAG